MDGIVQLETTPNHAYRYNGKELDEISKTYEYGFRYYDPSIGKFTGVDPIADQFAWVSPFNYAENEPIGHIDLWGLQKAEPNEIKRPDSNGRLGMVSSRASMKVKGYHLYGSQGEGGNQFWITSRSEWDGGLDASWFIGVEAVDEFRANVGTYEYLDKTYRTGIALGGNERGSIMQGWGDVMSDPTSWIAGMHLSVSAIRTLKPNLGGVNRRLDGYDIGQGFTGVFDKSTGKIGFKPSNRLGTPITLKNGTVVSDVVRQYGGHGSVADAMGGARNTKLGFAIIKKSSASLEIRWNSRTLNGSTNPALPQEYRSSVINQVRREFPNYKIE